MSDSAGLGDSVADASNLLLLGPSVNQAVDRACLGHLPTGPAAHVIAVNFSPSPEAWLERYDAHAESDPAAVVLVTTNASAVDADYDWPLAVEELSSPADLTGIGMVISKYLERWHDRGQVALCFDSLTALLQYDDLQNVYRFLHIISTRLAGADATAHFHLDPMTQDEQAVSTLRAPFDAVAAYDEDADSWQLARR